MSLDLQFNSGNNHKDNFKPKIVDEEQINENRTQIENAIENNGDQEEILLLYEQICDIKDPEFDLTLEQQGIVSPQNIKLTSTTIYNNDLIQLFFDNI